MLLSLLPLICVFLSAWAGTVRVDVLDVGQGDSILVRTPAGKNILIDAGPGDVNVPKLLTGMGVTSLDLVIATHPHADHIGGMDDVLDALPVKNYVDNGLPHTTQTYAGVMKRIEDKHIPYKAGVVGMTFNLDDGAKLEVLFPSGGPPLTNTRSDLNSNSVVTRLTHGSDCFLFVGDSEEPTEQALLKNGLGQCDVLKVAHHGSNHSSTPAFLAAVKPKIALISVGVGNRYGHPGEETIGRLTAAGAAVYRTDLEGQLSVASTGHGVTVTTAHPPTQPVVTPPATAAAQPPAAPTAPATTDATGATAAPSTTPTTAPTGASAVSGKHAPPSSAPASAPSSKGTPAAAASSAKGPPANVQHDLDPAAAESMPQAACPFPASTTSEVFHAAGCRNAERIAPQNLICYQTREAAIAAGRRPAGCCNP